MQFRGRQEKTMKHMNIKATKEHEAAVTEVNLSAAGESPTQARNPTAVPLHKLEGNNHTRSTGTEINIKKQASFIRVI